ncbi:MAG TPA: sulfatase-like hydrolase/transferase [Acidimicrobiia bacterium]|nr:sulfatase-like hydrolase/transferase [Acidimicrobiia bacterium]
MNVLLITTDQQRADTLGVEGSRLQATPRLDALAAAGTRFSAARTQNPLCQPARATILTGTYPSTHGVTCNGIDLPADAAERSVATLLGRAGFRTAIIGKAHFASAFPFLPTGRVESLEGSARVAADWYGPYFGFDHAELTLFGHNLRIADLVGRWNWIFGPPPFGLHYARYLFRDGFERGVERLRLMQPEAAGVQWDHTQTWHNALPEEDHPTTWVADRAVEWLRAAEDPFFAWVSFADPHHPMDPPAPWSDRYAPADALEVLPTVHPDEFAGKPPMHKILSEGLRGRALEWANPGGATLTREELARMTAGYYGMVAQLDHAIGRVLDVLDERGIADDTLVLVTSDHGEFLGEHQMIFKGPFGYDSLLRIPLLARGPGIEPGRVVTQPVGTIDLVPTILAAAGVECPSWVEGTPLGSGSRPDYVLTEDDFNIVASIPMRTITTARYKLHRYLEAPFGELYDLDDDPGELVNRYDDPAYASVRSDLLALLDDVMNHDVRREPVVGLVA